MKRFDRFHFLLSSVASWIVVLSLAFFLIGSFLMVDLYGESPKGAGNEFVFFADGKSERSLEKALAASRSLALAIPRTILIEGTHYLQHPIQLTEKDSFLTIRGKNAVLIGGIELKNWQRDGKFFRAKVPSEVRPGILTVGDKFCQKSCWPESGTIQNKNYPKDLRWRNSSNGGWNRKLTDYERTHVQFDPKVIPEDLDLSSAEITLFHSWDDSTVSVKSFDRKTGIMELESSTEHPAGSFDNRNCVLLNLKAGLTRPGQWYFDRKTETIWYYPEELEKSETFSASISAAENIFLAEKIENFRLENLEIRLANTNFTASGLRAINRPGAVEIHDGRNITLSGLTITRSAGHGIKLLRCRNTDISGCRFENLGAGGIFTHEGEDETIADNSLLEIGLLNASSVSIHAGGKSQLVFVQDGKKPEKGSTRILRNLIDGSPYCGITCNGGPHLIEGNVISHCMKVLNDGAGIYCSRGKKTVLRGNQAYDIQSNKGLAIAYYFDEDSIDCLLEGNSAVNCPTPFLAHLSEKIIIRNNYFYSQKPMIIKLANSRNFVWENNLFVGDKDFSFTCYWAGENAKKDRVKFFMENNKFQNNRIISASGKYLLEKKALPSIFGIVIGQK